MIEIPESATLEKDGSILLSGRTVTEVTGPSSPHKFTCFNGDPQDYPQMLIGKEVLSVRGYGSFADINFTDDTHLTVGDGTNLRYYPSKEQHPAKFQLMLTFDDYSCLVMTVAMYGAIYAFQGDFDNPYYQGAKRKITPLSDRFDEAYFDNMIGSQKKDLSAKALLATEQRIPGLGNGVLQDILFNARINPKRKISSLNDNEKQALFHSIKTTLTQMTDGNGRDTEKTIYGEWGQYKSILSKNTYKEPCPECGGSIIKEAYLGGAVYYCPVCQSIKKH